MSKKTKHSKAHGSRRKNLSDNINAKTEEKKGETPPGAGPSSAKEETPGRKKLNIRAFIQHLKKRTRLNEKAGRVYAVLRAAVIFTAIRCLIEENYESFALCLLSLVLFLAPSFFEEQLKVSISSTFEAIIYMFIFAAEILGEVNHYYTAIPYWDTVLHTINGFLCAAVGFSLVDILNRRSEKISLSPLYLAIVAFCFSMTIGVLWEFIEFTFDQLFYLDMQKDFIVTEIGSVTLDPTHTQTPFRIHNIVRTIIETADGHSYTVEGGYLDIGIIDTMKDLLVNFLGAITFSVIGYFYVKKRDKKEKLNRPETLAQNLFVQPLSDEDVKEQEIKLNNMSQKTSIIGRITGGEETGRIKEKRSGSVKESSSENDKNSGPEEHARTREGSRWVASGKPQSRRHRRS